MPLEATLLNLGLVCLNNDNYEMVSVFDLTIKIRLAIKEESVSRGVIVSSVRGWSLPCTKSGNNGMPMLETATPRRLSLSVIREVPKTSVTSRLVCVDKEGDPRDRARTEICVISPFSRNISNSVWCVSEWVLFYAPVNNTPVISRLPENNWA